jgi:F-type H+-transporting ATPase subunit delta
MQGPSRAASVESRGGFTAALAGGAEPATLANELFSVVALLDGNVTLRRAVADPSREGSEKADLVQRLLGGRIGDAAVSVVKAVAAQRWSTERDLTDTLETFAVESVVAGAETGDRVDRVEDELFRFERIVAADPGLAAALADTSASAERRLSLVDRLLGGKVTDETMLLARQAVSAPRGRRFAASVEGFLAAAAARRDQQTATVISALPLGDDERGRLVAGLSSIYGGRVHLNTVVDPRVMGGIRVEIGDEVIDGTVIRKLEGARRAMGVS